jgi:uncharacterized protein YegP (UPF0339 family)
MGVHTIDVKFRTSTHRRKIMAGKFELKKAKDGQFYFNLKASNGEVILTSEMNGAKIDAENGIKFGQRECSIRRTV